MNVGTQPYRRIALRLVAGCLATGLASVKATEPLLTQAPLVTPATEQAVAGGLAYLRECQLEDGAFGASQSGRNPAVCALAGLAMLAEGSTPGRGTHGAALDRIVAYLVECGDQETGLIVAPDSAGRGPMYGHGFATLFLCECYGMSQLPELRERIALALQLIEYAQNVEGGWRYTPQPREADVSVTVCQVMALRAARNAGFAVPKQTIDRSIDYVRQCQNDDGGFRYMLSGGGPQSGFARSAAGLTSLLNAGIYEGPEIERAVAYLREFTPGPDGAEAGGYYYYGHYYAVQAMWHVGGESWRTWYPAVRDELLERQRDDGAWFDPAIGSEYATAMACIVLQTPNNYLPILQR